MRTQHVPVLLFALLAAGCTSIPVTFPAPGGTSTGAPTTGSPQSVAAEVIALTNEARIRNGLRALATSSRLMEAARLHAGQMAEREQAAHTISGARYPTMQSRLQAVGYPYATAAENVAWNQRSAGEVMSTWMSSSGHRANILDPNLTEIGAAMARSARGEPYWIQVFGRPR